MIEFHQNDNNKPISVKPESVIMVYYQHDVSGTVIGCHGGHELFVRESYTEVMDALKDAAIEAEGPTS